MFKKCERLKKWVTITVELAKNQIVEYSHLVEIVCNAVEKFFDWIKGF